MSAFPAEGGTILQSSLRLRVARKCYCYELASLTLVLLAEERQRLDPFKQACPRETMNPYNGNGHSHPINQIEVEPAVSVWCRGRAEAINELVTESALQLSCKSVKLRPSSKSTTDGCREAGWLPRSNRGFAFLTLICRRGSLSRRQDCLHARAQS